METLRCVESRTVVLAIDNVDTDQIIPARFLKGIDKKNLGRHLFADWRYDARGAPRPDFVLNRPEAQGARILIAGENFGCGSSREHAPWALVGFGFRVVISTGIADIFTGNAVKNGLLPITVDSETHRFLREHPGIELKVDLEARTLAAPGLDPVTFPIDRFSRLTLLQGKDQLDFLLDHGPDIEAFEKRQESPA